MIKIINIVPVGYHILNDFSSSGRSNPWQDKKIKSVLLAESFERLGNTKKANRLKDCGTFLEFKRYLNDNSLKLNNANFCKVRLCPLCSWRRSLKIFGQVSKIMNELVKDSNYEFLFLTLTVKNCIGDELSDVIDNMMSGYMKMFKRSILKKNVLGAFRALEVTHNTNRYSKSFDTYHPHFHCILMVNKSYFKKGYISQEKWSKLWQESIKSEYLPMVNIQKIDGSEKNIQKAVAEAAKYSVKDSDLFNVDELLQDKAIEILDSALANRRLISFRGEFARVQKELNLDDAIDGDLINCDCDDELRDDIDFVIERYRWNIGYFQYLRIDKNNEFEKD